MPNLTKHPEAYIEQGKTIGIIGGGQLGHGT